MSHVPIVNISKFLDPQSSDEEKHAVAEEIDRACREVGFFYLSGHGLPEDVMNSMLDNARTFFGEATHEEKESLQIKKSGEGGGDDARGFQRVNGGKKGAHECIDFYRPVKNDGPPFAIGQGDNLWPKTPSTLQPMAKEYVDKVVTIGTEVVRAMAMGLGVDEKIFTSRIDRTFWNLRLLAYEGKEPNSDKEKIAGIGEHTDFGILTILLTDPQKDSLQVLSKEGKWMPADPIPGCFTCNIGDMLSKWTDGQYKSTLHRVIHNSPKTRISIPLFFDPNFDAEITPVLPLERGDKSEDGILYKDMFVHATLNSIVV